jgi:outer membrane protease
MSRPKLLLLDESSLGLAGGGNISGGASNVTGPLFYGTIDLGYDLLRGPGSKAGPFVGYNRYDYALNAGGCVQIGSPSNPGADCVGAAAQPTSQIGIIEKETPDSVRVGAAAETTLVDRWKLRGDVAYVPNTKFTGTDQHLERDLIFDESGNGTGVRAEAFLSYLVTNQLSVGAGGRYWALWTTTSATTANGAPQPPNGPFRTGRLA